eukprot:gene285-biopygen6842
MLQKREEESEEKREEVPEDYGRAGSGDRQRRACGYTFPEQACGLWGRASQHGWKGRAPPRWQGLLPQQLLDRVPLLHHLLLEVAVDAGERRLQLLHVVLEVDLLRRQPPRVLLQLRLPPAGAGDLLPGRVHPVRRGRDLRGLHRRPARAGGGAGCGVAPRGRSCASASSSKGAPTQPHAAKH